MKIKQLFFTSFLLVISASALMIGCSKINKNEKPRPPIVTPSSLVGFDIAFPVQEIEEGINSKLKAILVDDVIDLNSKGDKLFLKVEKSGDLDLALRLNKIYASIPLNIEVAIKKKVMGISFSNKDTPITFEAILETQANATLDSLWNFDLDCSGMNLKWLSEPSFNIMGISIDLRSTIDKAIEQNENRILDEICGAINKSIDFKRGLTNIWSKVQKPIRIAKNPFYVWLHTIPHALNAKILPMVRDTLWMHAEYHGEVSISTEKRMNIIEVPLPNKGNVINDQSAIVSYISADIPLKSIEAIATSKMVGKTFTYEGYSARVDGLTIASKGQNVYAEVNIVGDISGLLKITGKPALTKDKKLTLENFKYEIESDDQLTNAASWLSHGLIERYISSIISIEIGDLISNLDSLANAGIAKSKVGNKLRTKFIFNKIESFDQQIIDDKLKWIFYLEGEADLILTKDVFNGTQPK